MLQIIKDYLQLQAFAFLFVMTAIAFILTMKALMLGSYILTMWLGIPNYEGIVAVALGVIFVIPALILFFIRLDPTLNA